MGVPRRHRAVSSGPAAEQSSVHTRVAAQPAGASQLPQPVVQDLVRKLAKLNEASRAMTRCRALGPLLDTILSLVGELFELESCAVLLLDPATERLRIERAFGYDPSIVGSYQAKLGEGITGQVALLGAPLYVPDVRASSDYIGDREGFRAELAAPLRIDGSIIGVLDAEVTREEGLSPADIEVFTTFADQAAVAVHNARLHENLQLRTQQLERQVRRLELLGKAAQALSSTLQLDELLQTILQLSREALRFDHCAVLLLDSGQSSLRLSASLGYAQGSGELRIALDQGVTGEVARTGKPLLVADVKADERYIRGVKGGRCEMAAPLIARGKTIGVLDAESTQPNAFDEADLELFASFAHQAASALANAEAFRALAEANEKLHRNVIEMERMNRQLLEHAGLIHDANAKLESRVHELLTLQEASRTITSSLDLDDTLDAIVRMARAIIHSSTSAIKLIDEETKEVRVRVRQGDASAGDEAKPATTVLGVPLRIGQRTIGSFEVGRADAHAFTDEEQRLIETLASQAAIAIENARLFENTQRTYFETIRSLAQALEARDSYTRGHSDRVTRYAVKVARAMGVSETECKLIGHASLLHDIGKIGIADAVLNKSGRLTDEDRKAIECHPVWGDTIIGPIRILEKVQVLVRHHHERYDGTGYPDRRKGEEIPLGARIIAVADAFDAMTSTRPYRVAISPQMAKEEIRKGAGTQFDPQVVRVFLRLLDSGELLQEASFAPAVAVMEL